MQQFIYFPSLYHSTLRPGQISGYIPAADRHGGSCKFSQNSVGGGYPESRDNGDRKDKIPSAATVLAVCSTILLRNGS